MTKTRRGDLIWSASVRQVKGESRSPKVPQVGEGRRLHVRSEQELQEVGIQILGQGEEVGRCDPVA